MTGFILHQTPARPSERVARGKSSEDQACQYLVDLGYSVMGRNFRWRGGELDIICLEPGGKEIVFVEVRSASAKGPWLRQSITWAKRRRLTATIDRFFLARPQFSRHARRFDMIWISAGAMDHWKNVQLSA